MAEKKKRVRPTLTQVRALENELSAMRANYDNLSLIIKDKDAEIKNLRQNYESLGEQYSKLREAAAGVKSGHLISVSKFNALKEKYDKLEVSKAEQKKRYDEVCLAHDDTVKKNRELSACVSQLNLENDEYAAEIIRLKSRGLLSRIFNL